MKIIVTLEGGIVQNVEGLPPGFELEVRDYDIDGYDETDNAADYPIDGDGNQYAKSIYV